MGEDLISVRAGESRMDVSTSPRDAVMITPGWDLGDAEMSAVLAQGADGGVRLGDGGWGESRSVSFELECTAGNVPGDASGRAINRASGRTPVEGQAATAGDLSVSFPVDMSDRNPTTVDMACEVRSSMAGTVHLEALRAGVVVATTSRTVTADGVGRNGVENPRFAAGATGWTSGAFITSAGFTGVTQAPGDMPDGSGPGFRVAATNPTATARYAGVAANTPAADHYVPVVPGQPVTFGVRGLPVANSALGWRAEIYFYQADGTTYAGSVQSTAVQTGSSGRSVSATTTAPALAAFARVAATVQSSAAETFDVWFADLHVGDVDYYADGDSAGWAWVDPAAPHACASRRVTGAWTRIEFPAASIPGTGVLTMRARLASATAGTRLESRNPVFGEGLSGVYHDQYTPGAVATPQGRSIRPASGKAWANAFAAGVSRVIGAVQQEGSPTLVRSADDLAETGTLDIQRASAPAPQDMMHARGYATVKVSATTSPLWRLTPRVWPGTVTNTAVGAMPVWRASLPVPGDVDAIGSAVATFTGARRDALASLSPSMPVLANPTPSIPSWTTGAGIAGRFGTVASGAPPSSLIPVVEYTAPGAGRFEIDQHLQIGGAEVEQVALVIDGRMQPPVAVDAYPISAGGGAVLDGLTQPWRWVRFGPQTLQAGSRIQVAVGSSTLQSVVIDAIALTQVGTSAKAEIFEEEIPSGFASGDDIPATGSATLNGRTATLGGTWSTPASWGYASGYASFSGAGTSRADLSSAQTLGTAMHVTLDAQIASAPMLTTAEVGLFASSGTRSVKVGYDPTTLAITLTVTDGSGTVATRAMSTALQGALSLTKAIDVRVQVDYQGRLIASWAMAGQRLRTAVRAHYPMLAGGTYNVAARSNPGDLRVYSLRMFYGNTLSYDNAVNWEAGQGQRLIDGGTPRPAQGSRPYVFIRSAKTALDSPDAPNLHPTTYAVTITPRVLQVPR